MDDLLNWLLQGGLVALASSVMLRVVDPSRTRARYAALWIGLGCVLLLPAVPSIWLLASPPQSSGAMSSPAVPIVSIPGRWWTSNAFVLALMALWSTAYAVRVVRALVALRCAKRACTGLPPELETRLDCWNQLRARGRRTRLVLSDSVRSAAVLGCGSPVIAIASDLVARLTEDELDRVVIHEWAHVQRRDDYANIASLLVRVAAGWHPAVWWLNRQLHLEREVACDEVAVAATGSAKVYAACLAKLASLPARAVPAVPAVAALSSSGLRHRIVRVLSLGRASSSRSWRAVAAGAGVLLAATGLAVGGLRFVEIEAAGVARIVPDLVAEQLSNLSGALLSHPAVSPAFSRARATAGKTPPLPKMTAVGRFPPTAAIGGSMRQDPLDTHVARETTGGRVSDPVIGASTKEDPPYIRAVTTVGPVIPEPAIGESTKQDPPSIHAVEKPSPWATAADAGVAVGRGSQKAALATAGFFTRFGKRIAGSF